MFMAEETIRQAPVSMGSSGRDGWNQVDLDTRDSKSAPASTWLRSMHPGGGHPSPTRNSDGPSEPLQEAKPRAFGETS